MKSEESMPFVLSIYPEAKCYRGRDCFFKKTYYFVRLQTGNFHTQWQEKTTQKAAWNAAAKLIMKEMAKKFES